MNPSNPLESIFYIKVPENFVSSDDAFKIDTSVELPVQNKINEAPGDFNPSASILAPRIRLRSS